MEDEEILMKDASSIRQDKNIKLVEPTDQKYLANFASPQFRRFVVATLLPVQKFGSVDLGKENMI